MFVLNDCDLGDALQVQIDGGAGQGDAFGAHLNAFPLHLKQFDVSADETARVRSLPDRFAGIVAVLGLAAVAPVVATK